MLILSGNTVPDDVEGLFSFDSVLKSPELFLLGPVVEGGDKNDNDDGDEDSNAFDPAVILFFYHANCKQMV